MEFRVSEDLKYHMGIYAIVNNITGKSYIGSAVSFKERFWLHHCLIRAGRHDNHYLQRSYDKHGAENFHFELIELVKNKDTLIQREQFYIDLFEAANPELGYNLRSIAHNNFGVKRSQESKDKVSKTHGRKILKFDLEDNLLGTYDSVSIAARECGVLKKGITKICVQEKGTYKGYKWKFEGVRKLGLSTKGIKSLESSVEKRINTLIQNKIAYPIKHYKEDGSYVGTYDSLYFAAKATGFKSDSIKNVCTGHRKSLFGHVFSYDK